MTIKSILPALAILAMTAGSLVGGLLVVKNAKTGEVIAEVDPATKTPVKIGGLEVIIESKELSATEKKAKAIVIPVVDFMGTTIEEAVDFCRSRSRELDGTELDPSKKGINFRIMNEIVGELRIHELKLRGASIRDVLMAIAQQTGLEVKFGEQSILLKPAKK